MSTIAFDTLKFSRALRDKAKLTTEQAEAFADALSEALHDDLSTKTDLKEAEFRLESKVEASKTEILKWMFGTIGFQTLIILAAVAALSRITHP